MKDKKTLLQSMLLRAGLLQPETCSRVSEYLKSALEAVDNPDAAQELAALRERAINGDPAAYQELNALRVINVNNFVTAQATALAFFNVIPLEAADVPYLQNNTRQEVKARYIGEDGKARMMQAAKTQTNTHIPLRLISSDSIEFKIFDVYKGNVADDAMAQFDVSHDVAMKVNAELWVLILDQIANNFNYTNSRKELRTLNLHSSVRVANLPTGNLITLSGNTNSSKCRFDVMRKIAQWCMQWGTSTLSTGEVSPVSIYVPSIDAGDMLDEISADSADGPVIKEIKDVGHVVSLGGKTFNVIPDATLDPAQGLAVVRTNKPLGDAFTKAAGDYVFPGSATDITPAQRAANKAEMSARKVYGAVAPEANRLGVIGVRYRNAQ